MNIAIIGYGKMGKEIEKAALERGHSIGLIVDLNNASDLNRENLKEIDVAIEFSSPESGVNNISTCLRNDTPIVSGTTGWLEKWDEMVKLAEDTNGALFYASNYSIGVNIMFAISSYMADIMSKFPDYDVSMEEIHHIHKLDAPSGTALTLANQIIDKIEKKKSWSLESAKPDQLLINAKREGEVNGYHKVSYDSDIDTITVSHNAKSRKGFALGALMAAEFIKEKTGVFSMKELLNL